MDRRRRRYVPGTEGLEGRKLLSAVDALAPPVAAAQVAADPAPSDATATPLAASRGGPRGPAARPLTPAQEQAQQQAREEAIQLRLQRIDRLPNFLQSLDPGRALPVEEVAAIQQELRGLITQLRPPAQPVAEGFIGTLRDAIAQSSVQPQTVASMNVATERLLASAGASERSIGVITEGLTALARTASGSDRAVPVMTNDYALVVQTALGVGRPISRAELVGLRSPLTSSAGLGAASGGLGGGLV